MDTGVGMSFTQLENLFKESFDDYSEITEKPDGQDFQQGIGLGLRVVKAIVEVSGGSIAADSEGIGLGSVFAFSMKMGADRKSLESLQE